MIPYDPEDSAVKLVDSLYIIDGETLNVDKLEMDVAADVELVVNQARQACACDPTAKRLGQMGKLDLVNVGAVRESDTICQPCEARFALNCMRAVAERG